MARYEKPISIPNGVEVTVNGQVVSAKGKNGSADHEVHESVEIHHEGDELRFSARGDTNAAAMIGTTRSLLSSVFTGVTTGFEKKLELVGVGYRAQAQGMKVNLNLGFSHPIDYEVPEGVTVETPSATEVVVKGMSKQQVGQVAAEIRGFRPPEPYKGKGVRYSDERVIRKEAKKK